jgi:dienelactone hydrolase
VGWAVRSSMSPTELTVRPLLGVRRWRPRRPRARRILAIGVVALLAILVSILLSTVAALGVPAASGSAAVGRSSAILADPGRDEVATPGLDARRVRLTTWFPAIAGSGSPAPYVEGLERIRDGLIASGSFGPFEATGVGFVRDHARIGATPDGGRHPVVLLSPGNATNVAFYAGLAEELASHGYVVVGIDHPYQVAAVDLGDTVAVYAGDAPLGEAATVIPARIDERVADVTAVLDALETDPRAIGIGADQLDLTRIGMLGHSNGGVTAALVCRSEDRVGACMNMDGQLGGGPLAARPDPRPPTKPFLYLTKEIDLADPIRAALEAGHGAVRVVVSGASHDQFGDGARFVPRVLPGQSTADAVGDVARSVALAFFDGVFRPTGDQPYDGLAAPLDLRVEVYPLQPR